MHSIHGLTTLSPTHTEAQVHWKLREFAQRVSSKSGGLRQVQEELAEVVQNHEISNEKDKIVNNEADSKTKSDNCIMEG